MKLAISLLLLGLALAQEMPQDFFQFDLRKIELNHSQNWNQNSIFGPIRTKLNNIDSDSLIINSRFGFTISNNSKKIYGYGRFKFNKHFYGYIYPRIVSDPSRFERYSGIARDITRGGFSSGETDLSGICYQNDWMILQFGRGRQSWGAGNDIQLAISESSNSYDYGMIDLDFGKLRVRYFHGYLETDLLQINRYILGRGLEWKNKKNLIFGISEIVIYSGKNRPVDLSYFNPISTHLEVELNNRQNDVDTGSGNGAWQLSLDYLNSKNIRISINYLFDEFILDKKQYTEGKGFGSGYSFRTSYFVSGDGRSKSLFYFSVVGIGTNTFKHEEGSNNFVQRNKPLGWAQGSDNRQVEFGFKWLYNYRLLINIIVGKRDMGENNILYNPYLPYVSYERDKFPSGVVEVNKFFKFESKWIPNDYSSYNTKIQIIDSDKSLSNNLEINFEIELYYNLDTIL